MKLRRIGFEIYYVGILYEPPHKFAHPILALFLNRSNDSAKRPVGQSFAIKQ
ncbi:MAG: hypothetical protein MHPDNHAH_01360 [Anaerolineales bacterium]|nr:hypothetical protein [Anaerolineales bacterium]